MIRRRALGAALQATGRFRPELLVLDLTHGCNSRCGGCGFRDPLPGELDAARWIALAAEGRGLGFSEIMLTGGEPLTRPDISELLPALSEILPVSLISNGLALARHAPLVRAHVHAAFISLDGADEETYSRLRGVRGLGAVLRGVAEIRGAVHTHARVTVWSENVDQLVRIADLAQRSGFDAVSFLAPDTTSMAFGEREQVTSRPPTEAQRQILRAQINALRAHPILSQSVYSLDRIEALIYSEPSAPRCLAPWTAGLVLPDGRWSHCFFLETDLSTADGLGAAIRESRSARKSLNVKSNPTCQRCVCWRG